jgi:hypothetical protein
MRKLLRTYLSNFLLLTKRLFTLLFRNRNKPEVRLYFDVENELETNSYLKVTCELENVLLLKVDDLYHPVFHDYVKLNLTFPLVSDRDHFEFTGIGAFKSSNSYSISGGDYVKVNIDSLQFDRHGLIKKSIHGMHDAKVTNNELTGIVSPQAEVNDLDVALKSKQSEIRDYTIQTKLSDFQIKNISEEELIIEFNK